VILNRAIRKMSGETAEPTREQLILTDPTGWRHPGLVSVNSASSAMKVATVSACVEIRSDSIGKMPFFVMDNKTRTHLEHYLDYLLSVRPNEDMTPYVFKKMVESSRLLLGNAYVLIIRSNRTGVPIELIPLNTKSVAPVKDQSGKLWYVYVDVKKGTMRKLHQDSVIHLKGFSEDGIEGQSVLSRAQEVIQTAREQQMYEGKFYSQNAAPSGVLKVMGDLSKAAKDKVRDEWNNIYAGVDNSFRVAVLDNGMDYTQIGMSQRDAQFVESKDITVADIARFFLVPLYKLQAGKQSYSSNEQNAIDYVTTALHPTITQWEEEFSYKLLFSSELRNKIEVRVNMNAELRGDTKSRVTWYRGMRDVGAYSVDDIRAYEDLPDVPGGDLRIAPLNSIPLEQMDRYFDHLMSGGAGAPGHAGVAPSAGGGEEE
jgi:HK97 family phage portal protein